ncbi:MAG: uracil-DNA glycosylase [Armatimonadota bacterium]
MDERWQTIDVVRYEASVCCRCDLCYTRKHVVFGDGPTPARIMIVGEGPGADEDIHAKPFVGRAGKLLDNILLEAGIKRDETWITNTVRCRPVAQENGVYRNRTPRADEIKACEIWTHEEYRFVHPEAVVCLGAVPAQAFISKNFRIGEGRGKWHIGRNDIPTTATYHPAYVLRLRGEDRQNIQAKMVEDLRMAAILAAKIRV